MTRRRADLDLCDPRTVRAVARRAGLVPRRRLGQNFLVDRGILDTVVAALRPAAGETVLEIGMGIGTLTVELAARAARVVAVEIDPRCIQAARMTLRDAPTVEIVEADALSLDLASLGLHRGWLAAGNIPYQMTGPLLSRLFESGEPPARAVFLVQREVAHRLAGEDTEWSLATVVVRSVASVEIVAEVEASSFLPAPRVRSTVIRMQPAATMSAAERAGVLRLARPAFQLRRKTLRHGLARALGDAGAAATLLERTGIDAGRRPGTLSLGEWRDLAAAAPPS